MNRVPCVRVVRVGVEVRGGSRLAWGVGRATRTRESALLLFEDWPTVRFQHPHACRQPADMPDDATEGFPPAEGFPAAGVCE